MVNREKLVEICAKLAHGCKEELCANCKYKDLGYPRCRGAYMADRIMEAMEEQNDIEEDPTRQDAGA